MSTLFSVRLTPKELEMINEIADRSGNTRNLLMKLGVHQLGEVKFLDAREFRQQNDRLEGFICELVMLLRTGEGLDEQMDEERKAERILFLERFYRNYSKIELIQDQMIESQERTGQILTSVEQFFAILHERLTNHYWMNR